jgi:2-dehydropantoate 2-reductase
MRFAVMGAGAVGGYFGALLARAGHRVAFIARGEHLRAMRERGLRVRSWRGDFELSPVEATDEPAEVGPVECVLFAVKTYDTESAARRMAPMVGPQTVIISLQNGVESEEVLSGLYGAGCVMGGLAFISAFIESPGLIAHTAAGKLTFGEMDGSASPRSLRLKEVFEAAGLESELSADVPKALWNKLVWNACFNPLTTITGANVQEILDDPVAREVARASMVEVAQVAGAWGVELPEGAAEEMMERTRALGPITSSMHHDWEAGKPIESHALSGVVLERGRAKGVPTPVNAVLYAMLRLMERARERG